MTNQQQQIMQNQARELASIILGSGQSESPGSLSFPQGSQGVQLLQGVVVSVGEQGYVDVQIAGADLIIPRLRYLEGYNPAPGDVIWLMRKGRDTLILGRLRNIVRPDTALPIPTIIDDPGAPAFATGFDPIVSGVINGTKLQYWVDPDGICHIRGQFVSTAGSFGTVFTLPPEARPYQHARFACSRMNNVTDFLNMGVWPDGHVDCGAIAAGATINAGHICFPSVQFDLSRLRPLPIRNGMQNQGVITSVYVPSAFVRDDGWVLLTGWLAQVSAADSIAGSAPLVDVGEIAPPQQMLQRGFYTAGGGVYSPSSSRFATIGGTVAIPGVPAAGHQFCLDGFNFFTPERENDWLLFGSDIDWFNNGGEIWENFPEYLTAGVLRDKYGVTHCRGLIRPNSAGFDTNNFITKDIPYTHAPYIWINGQLPPLPQESHSDLFAAIWSNIHASSLSPASEGAKRVLAGVNVGSTKYYPYAGDLRPDNAMTWNTGSFLSLDGMQWRTDWNSDYGYI